jgi:MerR family copper efflux transcriptional regulator
MRIGDLARRAGVNIQTIRFYERERVLREPLRTTSGYRSYSEHDLEQVVFVRKCQHLGFTLKEIMELAELHAALGPSTPAARDGIRGIAGERLRLIEEKIRALQEMREHLRGMLAESGICPAQKIRNTS